MAVEAKREHLFGLIKGRTRDLSPRTRVVLRNYHEEEAAGFAAERISAVVNGSASVRLRTIKLAGSTDHGGIFKSRERELLRRRDVNLASDWSIFGTRTVISYRQEGRPRPRIGEKRVRKDIEEECEGVFDTDKISEALSWSNRVVTGSAAADKFILGLTRKEVVASLVQEEKRENYDLMLQVFESVPRSTILKGGGIEWVDVWRNANGERYARVHFKDSKAKTMRFKLSAYEPGGSAPVLRQ